MKCLRPVIVEKKLYRCGKCYWCRVNQRSLWTMRLQHEITQHKAALFCTLTYNEDNLPSYHGKGILVKDHLQRFFKRLRKEVKNLRYFACGEYGERSGRPHYHAVVFGYDEALFAEAIRNAWRDGFTQVVPVIEVSQLGYVAGYVSKKLLSNVENGELPAEFHVCSHGIGSAWLRENAYNLVYDMMLSRDLKPLPRYYIEQLEKLYPDEICGFRLRRERESELRLCDKVLEIAPAFGGRLWSELNPVEQREARDRLAESAYRDFEFLLSEHRSKEVYYEY